MIPHPHPTYILGLSCFYHDSAAVLLKDGEIIFAAQEERYTRIKHDQSFPKNAIFHALKHAGITMEDIAAVGFYEKPFLKFFDRMLYTFFKTWPRGYLQYLKAMQSWMKEKLWIPQILRKELQYKGPIFFVQHHESHAASAFFCSGFTDAAIVTVDGVGEWATTTIGKGDGDDFRLLKEIHYPHSLGLLYSAITYYLGFKVNSAEYKVMGLAPYGKPVYVNKIHKLIDVKEDGSFALNMRCFTFERGMRMTGHALEKLFGVPRRKPETPLAQFHKDIARSLQDVTEEVMLKIVRHAKKVTGSKNLCLAGGVALNCVANGKILRSGLFENIFVQPAAGDAGGALGVAKAIWHRKFIPSLETLLKSVSTINNKQMSHVFLGNAYTDAEIEVAIRATSHSLPFHKFSDDELIAHSAQLIADDNVIGWFQGRMEFGPRALGNRSIIADARKKENWQKVNLKIKFRESFRPFAPTVLEERCSNYFDLTPASSSDSLQPPNLQTSKPPNLTTSPFMLLVAYVHPNRRSEIPAVTHVDGSARIQTINREQNPHYYDLIKSFERLTGCPIIINTSFNIRGEPIVESPSDAINCFLMTDMDYLVMGNYLLKKSEVPKELLRKREEYLGKFELD